MAVPHCLPQRRNAANTTLTIEFISHFAFYGQGSLSGVWLPAQVLAMVCFCLETVALSNLPDCAEMRACDYYGVSHL